MACAVTVTFPNEWMTEWLNEWMNANMSVGTFNNNTLLTKQPILFSIPFSVKGRHAVKYFNSSVFLQYKDNNVCAISMLLKKYKILGWGTFYKREKNSFVFLFRIVILWHTTHLLICPFLYRVLWPPNPNFLTPRLLMKEFSEKFEKKRYSDKNNSEMRYSSEQCDSRFLVLTRTQEFIFQVMKYTIIMWWKDVNFTRFQFQGKHYSF